MDSWLSAAVAAVLCALSGIHWYWLLGGRRGIAAAVPVNGDQPLFQPGKPATAAVALLLAAAAYLVAGNTGVVPQVLDGWVYRWGGWTVGTVFLLRAVGDFRWVGLFKQKSDTRFAIWDTRIYSPLCLGLGAAIIAILL